MSGGCLVCAAVAAVLLLRTVLVFMSCHLDWGARYARERRQSMARLQKQAEADRNFAEKLQQMMQEEESAQEKLDRAAAEELEAAERSRARAYTDNPSDSEDSSSDDDMEADSVDAEAEEESRRTREAEERRLRRDRVRMAGELDKQHRNLSWETRYFVLQVCWCCAVGVARTGYDFCCRLILQLTLLLLKCVCLCRATSCISTP